MKDSLRVLNRSSGALDAKIMFIGEAPGRLGADSTGIPFHGDKAGNNFEDFLAQAGINRDSIFVTNAVLCNPKDDKQNNGTPNREEIENCSSYLKRQIELLNPQIVVTLGAIALQATALIEYHDYSLKENVRSIHAWFNRKLIPLYHPGQRALLHRSILNQNMDYQFVGDKLKNINGKVKSAGGLPRADVFQVANLLTAMKPMISYFSLHKLFYLVEYNYVKKFQRRPTNGYIVRQKDGPYCTDLHLSKLKRAFSDLAILDMGGKIFLRRNAASGVKQDMPMELREIIEEVVNSYGGKKESDLKSSVYLTQPMRKILRMERNGRVNMVNSPIDFSVHTLGAESLKSSYAK